MFNIIHFFAIIATLILFFTKRYPYDEFVVSLVIALGIFLRVRWMMNVKKMEKLGEFGVFRIDRWSNSRADHVVSGLLYLSFAALYFYSTFRESVTFAFIFATMFVFRFFVEFIYSRYFNSLILSKRGIEYDGLFRDHNKWNDITNIELEENISYITFFTGNRKTEYPLKQNDYEQAKKWLLANLHARGMHVSF